MVTVDLGEGDETYLIGSVEQAAAGVDTITPAARSAARSWAPSVGTTVAYRAAPGVPMSVTIRSAGELLAPSA